MTLRKQTAIFLAFSLLFAATIPIFAVDGSTIVYITKSGKCYHNDGCGSLSRSKIETTLQEAVAKGLSPCSKCDPPTLDGSVEPNIPDTPAAADPQEENAAPGPAEDNPVINRVLPQSVTIASGYGLPVIPSGGSTLSLFADYDGTTEEVTDYILDYDPDRSGLQTVTVTIGEEAIRTQAVVYDSAKEYFFDFGDVVDADAEIEQSFAVLYGADRRFLGLTDVLVLDGHETAILPNDLYALVENIKLITVDKRSFMPTAEAVHGF